MSFIAVFACNGSAEGPLRRAGTPAGRTCGKANIARFPQTSGFPWWIIKH
jgi:hypothetical protein